MFVPGLLCHTRGQRTASAIATHGDSAAINAEAFASRDSPLQCRVAVVEGTGEWVPGGEAVSHQHDDTARFIGIALATLEVTAGVCHCKGAAVIVQQRRGR